MATTMKNTILMGLLFGILASIALATSGAISAVYASNDDDNGHDETKHDTNPGQSKDPSQKNHGCPKGEQGWESSNENCYHPG
jgi:hypothetical protein